MITILKNTHLGPLVASFLDKESIISLEKTCKDGRDASIASVAWERIAQEDFSYQFPRQIKIRKKACYFDCIKLEQNFAQGIFVETELCKSPPIRFASSQNKFCFIPKNADALHIFDVETGALLRKIEEEFVITRAEGLAAKLAINDKWVVMSEQTYDVGTVTLYPVLSDGKPEIIEFSHLVTSVAFDGDLLITGHKDGTLRLTNVVTKKEITSILVDNRTHAINTILVTADRYYTVSGLDEKYVTVIDKNLRVITTNKCLFNLESIFYNIHNPDDPLICVIPRRDVTDVPRTFELNLEVSQKNQHSSNRRIITFARKNFLVQRKRIFTSKKLSLNCDIKELVLNTLDYHDLLFCGGMKVVTSHAERGIYLSDYSRNYTEFLEYLAFCFEKTYVKYETKPVKAIDRINALPEQLRKDLAQFLFPLVEKIQKIPLVTKDGQLKLSSIFFYPDHVRKIVAEGVRDFIRILLEQIKKSR